MHILARDFWRKLPPTEAAAFNARDLLVSGGMKSPVDDFNMFLRRFNNGTTNTVTLQVLYATGRELYGYENFWRKGIGPTVFAKLHFVRKA